MRALRTQVAIVGAGPAGLLLSHLLNLQGVESIVVEQRSREYAEQRVRAGLLEQRTVDLLRQAGLAERLDRQGLVHDGFEVRFEGRSHRIDTRELVGRTVTMYGQQEVVKDLIRARLVTEAQLHFDVGDVAIHNVDTDSPTLRFTLHGEQVEVSPDFVVGCDGFHGISRKSIPVDALSIYERVYPFAWLGILAEAPPVNPELVYAVHERGFSLHSMRSPKVSRLYLEVAPNAVLADWPDAKIWAELELRLALAVGPSLKDGPILERSITTMRSFVVEPMQYRRLFLAGDAAHVVPPTAAKGLNLAVADVRVLAEAFGSFYVGGNREPLERYSETCLAGVWRAQEFSAWMTWLLHRGSGADAFEGMLRRSRLQHLVSSRAAATSFVENYVG